LIGRRSRTASPLSSSASNSLLRGAAAEQLAADYLQARGLKLIARNLRCRAGEIDLVCLDGELLAIIEVRQRSGQDFGGALASVTPVKQRRIIRAAQFVLRSRPGWRNRAIRFDVMAVQGSLQGAHDIIWVKDAFRAT
jgi:putative endonuclease